MSLLDRERMSVGIYSNYFLSQKNVKQYISASCFGLTVIEELIKYRMNIYMSRKSLIYKVVISKIHYI